MNVTPTGPQGEPITPSEDQEPDYDQPPNQEFPKNLTDKDSSKTGQTKEHHHKKKPKHAQQGAPNLENPFGFAAGKGMEAGIGAGMVEGGGKRVLDTSAVDKIVQVFQENQLFGANGVNQVRVSDLGSETVIGVSLENGVEVNINLAAGGRELNITIAGLTAAAQAAADRPENQLMLREKLTAQGLIVHQIQSYRADTTPPTGMGAQNLAGGPVAPATFGPTGSPPPQSGESRSREGGQERGGGQRGGGQDRGGRGGQRGGR